MIVAGAHGKVDEAGGEIHAKDADVWGKISCRSTSKWVEIFFAGSYANNVGAYSPIHVNME